MPKQPGDWLVSIRTFDCPTQMPTQAETDPRLFRMLKLWECNVGPLALDDDADVEDFAEQLARLDAAIVGFGAPHVWLALDGDTDDGRTARNLGTGETLRVEALQHLPKYGAQSSHRSLRHALGETDPAGRYFLLDTFVRHAGREIHVCTLEDGPSGFTALAEDMAARGQRRLFVKAAESKYGVWTIDLPDGDARTVSRAIVESDLGWATIHFEGVKDAFVLQQHVAMSCEYRLFVVGHEVVTGAGCIEHHTPLFNEAPFDPKVEMRRGSREVASQPGTVERLVAFGRRVAAEFRVECPDMHQYTLDVAIGPDGAPLVIECNDLLNSGLYASDTRLTTSAMAEHEISTRRTIEGATP